MSSAVNYLFCSLLFFSWQFAASARAATTPDGNAYLLVAASSSIDGIDCITADDAEEELLQVVADKSAGWPNDSDNGPSVSADRATVPTRTNKKPLHFAETHFEVVTIQELAADPVLLFPVHCFYSVHEHIRERAPPSLVSHL